MKLYAYCRVSTERQSMARQIENITEAEGGKYKGAAFYSDKYTGATMARPEWQKLYKRVKAGDTIVFDSVSRMSRDAAEGAAVYEELYERGVNLVFLNEPYCNTDTYKNAAAQSVPMTGTAVDCILEGVNKYLMTLAKDQIRIAFEQAEKERKDIGKRVSDGMRAKQIEAAKRGESVEYGRKDGATVQTKKSAAAKEIIRKHSKDFGGTLNDADVMKLCGIARNSYYKYKRELAAQIAQETEQA